MAGRGIVGFSGVDGLSEFMAGYQGRPVFIAGGTDQIVNMRNGFWDGDLLVDLSRMDDLDFIERRGDWIHIGGGTSFARIADSDLIRQHGACLAEAARSLGSVQIRDRATIGGNVATASPAADGLPPLTALKARAQVAKMPYQGPMTYEERVIDACGRDLAPRELIVDVRFPAYGPQWVSGFEKIGARREVSIAKLSLAVALQRDSSGEGIQSGRAALGALGDVPICPDDLERFFQGRAIDHALPGDLAQTLSLVVQDAIPGRPSMPYKRSAVRGLAMDVIHRLLPRTAD
jgi:carbon-monoxide dehydrogenase medium subunit